MTLFVEGWNGGSRFIPIEQKDSRLIQEWRLTGMFLRLRAMRGLPLKIRFAVTPESDWLYGVNISNWPEGYDSKDAKPDRSRVKTLRPSQKRHKNRPQNSIKSNPLCLCVLFVTDCDSDR